MAVMQMLDSEKTELPFAKSFAGHETFAFRHSWLKKGIGHLGKDPELFQREDAIVTLGVGKNMVRSIRHWCLATRVAEEEPGTRSRRLKPTKLGAELLNDSGWDPFLEDDATMWLLHWNLASSNTKAATWYWAFNKFHEYAFTRATIAEALAKFTRSQGWSDISESTLKRDVDCLVHTYLPRRTDLANGDDPIECPLAGLGILVQESDGERLRFGVGPKPTLPIGVFAWALAMFWNQTCCESPILELHEITNREGSPALVFRLDEDSVLNYLDDISRVSKGAMRFDDTALVRRVVRPEQTPLDAMAFLEDHYCDRK
ncbi:MAG: DUF4007 family protein [Armatimonadota bacterium]